MNAWLNKLRRYRWAVTGRRNIKTLVRQKHNNNQAIKIILGSSDHSPLNGDWINTDIPQFDITNASHWEYIFGAIKIDNLLAEHVMEHLTPEQNLVTFKLAQNYLNKGGTYRIALPDKNNPDPAYQSGTKPGGSDEGSHDHKLFFSLEDYKQLLKDTSFTLTPLEYYDNKGQFHFVDFDNSLGYISRSKKNNFHYPPIPNYSSLIFDLKIPV